MFRPMRRIKNQLPDEESKALLRQNKRAAFSVIGEDGYPYTIPIDFYYDEGENRIYFHSAKTGHKIDAILACDKVCLTTWNEGYREDGDWSYHVSSCVVFGRASLVTDLAVAEDKIRAMALKYYPTAEEVEIEISKDFNRVQMVAIDIDHLTGKLVHEK